MYKRNTLELYSYNIFEAIRKDLPRIKIIKNKITKIEIHNCFDGNMVYFYDMFEIVITYEKVFEDAPNDWQFKKCDGTLCNCNNSTRIILASHDGYVINDRHIDYSKLFLRPLSDIYITEKENLIDGKLPDKIDYDISSDEIYDEVLKYKQKEDICLTYLHYYFFGNTLSFLEEYCDKYTLEDDYECFIEEMVDDIKVIFYY